MGRKLAQAAIALDCSERTLRRYFNEGLLRGERVDRRGEVRISLEEERYLRQHWTVLSCLRRALRTEPGVRLAVLFGSMAVGEEHSGSDIDLLVDHASNDPLDLVRLRRRLQARVEREVHLVLLDDAKDSPALLADLLVEGRVIVNRGDAWKRLQGKQGQIFRAAAAEAEGTHEAAWRAVDEARARLAS